MTREDLARFAALPIDFGAIGLLEPGVPQEPIFATRWTESRWADWVVTESTSSSCREMSGCSAWTPPWESQGAMFCRWRRTFASFCPLSCFAGTQTPISQIWWTEEEQFRDFLKEESERSWEGMEDVLEQKRAALAAVAAAFSLEGADPYEKVKALQASYDPAYLQFSEEYYDVLGLERPDQEEI